MKRFVALILAVALGCAGLAYTLYDPKDTPAKIREIDELLQAYQNIDRFNGSVLVAQNDEVLLRKGYGIRNAEQASAHDADSMFRIYSITKPFTSTVVFKLIEDEKLSLSDKLSQFYPDIRRADEITIEHLLTHTSGLHEFTREASFENTEKNLVELLKNRPLQFPVGSSWSYCNSGYCLLGHIIAKVSGMSYEEAVDQLIFQPLQMKDSGFQFDKLTHPNKAIGYRVLTDSEQEATSMNSETGPFAAGAIYSTVDDLWKFHRGLHAGKIIRKETLQQAQSKCERNDGYGYGWQIGSRWLLKTVISHSGGASGFLSNYAYIPETDTCVILLNNHENANPTHLTNTIFDILEGDDVEHPTEHKTVPEDLTAYTGHFRTGGPRSTYIHVYVQGGRLAANFQGQPQGTLIAKGDHIFEQPEADVRLEFFRQDDQSFDQIDMTQGWSTMRGHRVEEGLHIDDDAVTTLLDSLRHHDRKTPPWHEVAYRLAHLHVHQDDQASFEELCNQIMDDFGKTDSPQIAERTVKMCLFSDRLPEKLLPAVCELADRAFAGAEDAGSFQWGGHVSWYPYLALSKGMADYRRGDFESSVDVLKSAVPFGPLDQHSACIRDMFISMGYSKLGKDEQAEQSFATAERQWKSLPPADFATDNTWSDRIILETVAKQAQQLLPDNERSETD